MTGPNQFVAKLAATWRLNTRETAGLLGCDEARTRKIMAGTDPIDDETTRERVRTLFEIRQTLWSLFRNETVENKWLREPHTDLNGQCVTLELVRPDDVSN